MEHEWHICYTAPHHSNMSNRQFNYEQHLMWSEWFVAVTLIILNNRLNEMKCLLLSTVSLKRGSISASVLWYDLCCLLLKMKTSPFSSFMTHEICKLSFSRMTWILFPLAYFLIHLHLLKKVIFLIWKKSSLLTD